MEATNRMEMPKWREMGNFWLSESAYAMPIRSQGSDRLAFWEYNEDVIGLVFRDMEGRQVCRFEEPNYYGDFVFFPYISMLAPVIVKGEAQDMVSKFIKITLGIALTNKIGSSAPLALCSYAVITAIHMYCNLKSYQSIQLRTLNPYRACLVFSEYLLSGQVPSVKEVNDKGPFFPSFPYLTVCKGHSEI